MSADLIKQLRDELQSLCAVVQSLEIEGTHIFVDASLIAEADAHLSSAGQSRKAWIKQADELYINARAAMMFSDNDKMGHANNLEADTKFRAHLRSVPDTPGMVPVEPVAFCVYLPSMDTQEYFDDLDDVWCVDLLTNNPDAQVTPLYAQPKEPTT